MLLKKTDYRRSVWKNGQGFTDEIAIYPPGANLTKGDFLWRLSSAQIEKSAPFSLFPAHDRIILVIKGNGIKLFHTLDEQGSEDEAPITPFEPYEFPGDISSRCELLGGAITDFSIFLRRGEVDSFVQVIDVEKGSPFEWKPEGEWNFAFALQGDFLVDGALLNEGNTYAFEQGSAALSSQTKTGKLLLISIARITA